MERKKSSDFGFRHIISAKLIQMNNVENGVFKLLDTVNVSAKIRTNKENNSDVKKEGNGEHKCNWLRTFPKETFPNGEFIFSKTSGNIPKIVSIIIYNNLIFSKIKFDFLILLNFNHFISTRILR
jgi:hypothetical protein